jgi:hypothetical protein
MRLSGSIPVNPKTPPNPVGAGLPAMVDIRQINESDLPLSLESPHPKDNSEQGK